MLEVITVIICGVWLLSIYCLFNKPLGHKIFKWHYVDKKQPQTFDGCSIHAKCAGCGKDVMQDSQGNWF